MGRSSLAVEGMAWTTRQMYMLHATLTIATPNKATVVATNPDCWYWKGNCNTAGPAKLLMAMAKLPT
jgi:hypothetical protein